MSNLTGLEILGALAGIIPIVSSPCGLIKAKAYSDKAHALGQDLTTRVQDAASPILQRELKCYETLTILSGFQVIPLLNIPLAIWEMCILWELSNIRGEQIAAGDQGIVVGGQIPAEGVKIVIEGAPEEESSSESDHEIKGAGPPFPVEHTSLFTAAGRALEAAKEKLLQAKRHPDLEALQKKEHLEFAVCKTEVKDLQKGRINPFQINYKDVAGKIRSPEEQAQEIIDYINACLVHNPDDLIGITYAANEEEATNLYAGYDDGTAAPPPGTNQAKVFKIIAEEINKQHAVEDSLWNDRVRILPIPTLRYVDERAPGAVKSNWKAYAAFDEAIEQGIVNIETHLYLGYKVLGLQNQDSKVDGQPFAIGGAVAKDYFIGKKQAYVFTAMRDLMTDGIYGLGFSFRTFQYEVPKK